MRALIQVVKSANVTINNNCVGKINKGLCVFLGIGQNDTKEICTKFINKLLKLRIFDDENNKTNLALKDVNGSILLVSQFTLYANCIKGNRPSFIESANPNLAKDLYTYSIDLIKSLGYEVQTGEFGAEMMVNIENDGPFTIWLDSEELNINGSK